MRNGVPLIVVIVLLVVGAILLLLFGGDDRGRRLDNSVIGLNGLAAWLEDEGVAFKKSNPRLSPNAEDLGLRVLPLYDVDLTGNAGTPRNLSDLLEQQTQSDIERENFLSKIDEIPSVVLLPKWTTGFIETGIAHERTLIPVGSYPLLFAQMDLDGLRLQRRGAEFLSAAAGPRGEHAVALFQAQSFAPDSLPDNCRPHLVLDGDLIVIACRFAEHDHVTYFVADPDLFNNHGLSLAENAAFAAAYLPLLASDDSKPLYIDSSPQLLTRYEAVEEQRRDYERSGSDLARFFEYPLSILWAVMLLVLAVLFWRGAVRFGPPEREDDPSVNQAKTVAIATKARLLRLSESDGEMVSDFVRHQLSDLTTQTLGPDLGKAGLERFFAHLSRKDATLAAAFQDTSEMLIHGAGEMSHAELSKGLDRYKQLLEKVTRLNGSLGIPKTR
ncbi:hypothetical protein [Hoeflea poritis]|uniref:DUF4350 domain-containing protein n=1 Tax=Hoeflea poritis TaxID=2993659 RepID=A0ABT4VVX0_9HYPH|nr:hypothetical protein [Hoeflea poritis]MDA4848340.1 hypothetical protein [Hoeflea poritis]